MLHIHNRVCEQGGLRNIGQVSVLKPPMLLLLLAFKREKATVLEGIRHWVECIFKKMKLTDDRLRADSGVYLVHSDNRLFPC